MGGSLARLPALTPSVDPAPPQLSEQHRRIRSDDSVIPGTPTHTKFGDEVHADHLISRRRKDSPAPADNQDDDDDSDDDDEANRKLDTNWLPNSASCALVVFDCYTKWLACYPKATKSANETMQSLQHFAGPQDKVEWIHTDNAPELKAAVANLRWRSATSTPYRPQSNGLAERMVRKVKDGARAMLV